MREDIFDAILALRDQPDRGERESESQKCKIAGKSICDHPYDDRKRRGQQR